MANVDTNTVIEVVGFAHGLTRRKGANVGTDGEDLTHDC